MPAVPFKQAGRRRAGLGHPEVQRVVEGLGGQSVGGDHEGHRGGLDRDLHVGEADLLEVGQLHPGRLDQGLGGGPAVAAVEVGVERPGVHPDADGHPAVLGLGGDRLDLGLLAQVARVEAQPLDAGLEGGEGHLVVEVDVGHDRHRRAGHDLGQPLGRRLLVAGAADDVGPGRRQLVDLGQGALHVGRLGGGHRLDRHRRPAADGHRPDVDLAGRPARPEQVGGGFHHVHSAVPGASGAPDGAVGQRKGLATGWTMSR